jgi:ATP adenylyltransferase/5',5'''-P-1,P-4-tetraphosphate phosphorylase II
MENTKLNEALQKLDNNIDSILNKENLKINDKYLDINNFKEQLSLKYNETTPENCVKSLITDEFFEQDNIKYLIKYLKIDNTKNKPILINKKNYNDPFAPPIKPDVLVEEDFFNLGQHRLIFTKFPLFKEQVLLVSKEFKSQYTHLTFENIRDVILLINSIDGCAFFNGGEKAGASQPRKHLQAFPYKSFPNGDKNFGMFMHIKNLDNLSEIQFENKLNNIKKLGNFYKINKFTQENIEHILFKFNDDMIELMKKNEKANITGELCLKIYEIFSEFLKLNETRIMKDFSFLLTQEFMFAVRRKEHDIYISQKDKIENKILNLNSLAFFFIIVSRDPEQIQEIKESNIIHDVYTKL